LPDCGVFNPLGGALGPIFISQSHQLNVQDLSDDGLFGTIQLAYDWQFGTRWVGGLFVDADLYDLEGHAKQRSSVSVSSVAALPRAPTRMMLHAQSIAMPPSTWTSTSTPCEPCSLIAFEQKM
jgi:hypothetical protein